MEYPTYLIHYGTLGQKWGVRRYQNPDGSLTPEGYEHYGREKGKDIERKELYKQIKKSGFTGDVYNNKLYTKMLNENKNLKKYLDKEKELRETKKKMYEERLKNPTKEDIEEARDYFYDATGRDYYNHLNDKQRKEYKKSFENYLDEAVYNRVNRSTEIEKLESEVNKNNPKKFKELTKMANDIVGKYGNKKIKTKVHGKRKKEIDSYYSVISNSIYSKARNN